VLLIIIIINKKKEKEVDKRGRKTRGRVVVLNGFKMVRKGTMCCASRAAHPPFRRSLPLPKYPPLPHQLHPSSTLI